WLVATVEGYTTMTLNPRVLRLPLMKKTNEMRLVSSKAIPSVSHTDPNCCRANVDKTPVDVS
ncbi:MAG TPA: hypothetical protein VFR82_06280, partial [Nitrospira sp.]|nr:hypothetical protein [Nitrospira sp.]